MEPFWKLPLLNLDNQLPGLIQDFWFPGACLTSKRWNFRGACLTMSRSPTAPGSLRILPFPCAVSAASCLCPYLYISDFLKCLLTALYLWVHYSLLHPPCHPQGCYSALQLLSRSPQRQQAPHHGRAWPALGQGLSTHENLRSSPVGALPCCPDCSARLHLPSIPCPFPSQCQLTSYCIEKIARQPPDCSFSNPIFLTTALF